MPFSKLSSLFNLAKFTPAFVAVCALAFLGGCGGSSDETEDAAPEAAGTPADAAPAASAPASGVHGRVAWDGPRPVPAEIETEGDPKCYAMHVNEPLMSERELVSDDGGVKFSFVYVKNPPEGDYPVPAEEAVLDQVGCQYIPHVLGVRAGQDISVRNSDNTLHNVRAFARANRPFNNSQPAGSPPRIKNFSEAEMEVRLKCDLHPWMTAFLFSMDHPFFATTDDNGAFQIPDLPAGDYTLVAWHEKYGEQEASVTVADGAASEVMFTFSPEA